MRRTIVAVIGVSLSTLAYLGCGTEAPTASDHVALSNFASWNWSEPVNLGPMVNSTGSDQNAFLTRDGLTLYISSNRVHPDAKGQLDIWVSQRATTADPWGDPRNVAALNSSSADLAPNISVDGHLLFFTSNRAGSTPAPNGAPSIDIYMSRRTNTHDPLAWGTPVKLGPGVNTADVDQAPMYLQNAEGGTANLYFNRGVLAANLGDIYSASITREGQTLGDAEAVTALNSPANEAAVSMRHDGREIFFWTLREGSEGQDLWTSTRRSVHDAWSTPTNLGAPLNTEVNDFTPNLSFDGRTLIFASNRAGSAGNDLWISERTLAEE